MTKPIKLISIYPSGVVEEQEMDKLPELEQLQKIVGGYIELVPYFNRYEDQHCIAFCNEMGKIENQPVNPVATLMWYNTVGRQLPDHLVGGIAIVVGPQHILEEM